MDSYSDRPLPLDYASVMAEDAYSRRNHIRVTAVYPDGSAKGELTVSPESLNPHGIVHGGCLASLADTVGGWAVSVSQRRHTVTVNYAFNFLRPAEGSNRKIYCTATPEKQGRTLSVYRMVLTDDAGVEVANGNFTFFLMDGSVEYSN